MCLLFQSSYIQSGDCAYYRHRENIQEHCDAIPFILDDLPRNVSARLMVDFAIVLQHTQGL